jgi:hypothetical protein
MRQCSDWSTAYVQARPIACVRVFPCPPMPLVVTHPLAARLHLSISGVAPAGVAQNSDHTYINTIWDDQRHIYVYVRSGVRVLASVPLLLYVSLLRLTFQQKVLLRSTNVYIVYYCYTEQSHSDMTTSDAGVFC